VSEDGDVVEPSESQPTGEWTRPNTDFTLNYIRSGLLASSSRQKLHRKVEHRGVLAVDDTGAAVG
jgi:hypothetical protein